MIFHVGLFLSIIILYIVICHGEKDAKKELLFLRIAFFMIFVLVATREMTMGNDTQTYLDLFDACVTKKWSVLESGGRLESGYLIFNIILGYISSSPRFFMVIMSALFNFGVYRFIKNNSKNYVFSVLMYIGLLFFYSSMTMMRQFLAATIVLFSFDYAKEGKLVQFIIAIALASTMHSTAWLAILIYPLTKLKFSRKTAITMVAVGLISTIALEFLLGNLTQLTGRINYYEIREDSNSLANILHTAVYLLFYIFARFTLKDKLPKKQKGRYNPLHFYLYAILAALAISIISIRMNVLSRATLYFNIFSIISIPNLLVGNIANQKVQKFLQVMLLIFLLSYSTTIIYFRPEWNSAYRYKSCLLKKEDYIC